MRLQRRSNPGRCHAPKARELETAKEILAEVFHIRPAEVEQMLLRRLEERSGCQEYQEGLWPATFCLGRSEAI